MSRMCGVILSAGASSRMGTDKALLPWPPAATGETLLSAAIGALKPFADSIVVVAGKNAGKIAAIAAANGASMVLNPDPDRGQFSSFQIGLREARSHACDAAMITLVDCPPLSKSSMEKLLESFRQALTNGSWGVQPEHNGKHGHPLFASRNLIDAFLAAPLSSNAREVKHTHAEMIESVPVPDSLVSVDVNTPAEYAALAAARAKPH